MMKLLLLFTIVPTAELYLLLEIGDRIGTFETIYLIIVTGIIGAAMAKREGLSVIRQIQEGAVNGVPPADKLVEGLMVLVGGVLLITPGVLTDFVGLSFIFPLTRRLLAGAMKRFVGTRFQFQGVNIGTPQAGPAARDIREGFSHPTPDEKPNADDPSPFKHPVR
jgi:UPF0716 protein FxsA